MLAARIARPAARAAPVRNLTQVSSEARRYSFAHAADDIIGEEWGGAREEGTGMSAGPGGRGAWGLLLARPPAPTPARMRLARATCYHFYCVLWSVPSGGRVRFWFFRF